MFNSWCDTHSLVAYTYTKGIWIYFVVECEQEHCRFVLDQVRHLRIGKFRM